MSFHPLVGDLTQLTTDELHKKFADLNKRISQAYGMGMSDAVQQLQMILESYRYEIALRNQKMMEEMANKTAEFKHIIDIGR
jgi:hypothetical protein